RTFSLRVCVCVCVCVCVVYLCVCVCVCVWCMCVCVCVYIYVYFIHWGEYLLEPLRISQVWPLEEKCVIYNCNCRCILTVRNRISTNKSRKLHFITFMTLFVFDEENKYLNPQANSKNSGSK